MHGAGAMDQSPTFLMNTASVVPARQFSAVILLQLLYSDHDLPSSPLPAGNFTPLTLSHSLKYAS